MNAELAAQLEAIQEQIRSGALSCSPEGGAFLSGTITALHAVSNTLGSEDIEEP